MTLRQDHEISVRGQQFWREPLAGLAAELRVPVEEPVDLPLVLLRLQRTGGIHEETSGLQKAARRLQKTYL